MRREDAEEWTQAQGQVLAGSWRMVHLAVKLGVPPALGLSTERWVKERLGGYVRLSLPERREAHRELAASGLDQRTIADITGSSQPTVHRDLDSSESPALQPAGNQQVTEPMFPDLDSSESPALQPEPVEPQPPARVSGLPVLRRCRCADLEIEPGTVDLIFTDPPYGRDHVAAWTELADLACKALKPGALVVAYTGQLTLPDAMTALSARLDYWWMYSVVHNGAFFQMHDRRVNVGWKPLLVFRKPGSGRLPWVKDIVLDGKAEKSGHAWQQAEAEAAYWIGLLTRPGDHVVDPFVGSGTTAIVCRDLDRRFTGCDNDESAYQMALERLK